MIYCYYINNYSTIHYISIKNFKTFFFFDSRSKQLKHQNIIPLKKQNELKFFHSFYYSNSNRDYLWLFQLYFQAFSFPYLLAVNFYPTTTGSIYIKTNSHSQWWTGVISNTHITYFTYQRTTSTSSSHSFTPATQISKTFKNGHSPMSRNSNYWFLPKNKSIFSPFPIPRDTHPTYSILVITETISLFVHPIALAVWLTTHITAGHLLIHLIGGATLALIGISPAMAFIMFISFDLTIRECTVSFTGAYIFTPPVSLDLHNTQWPTKLMHVMHRWGCWLPRRLRGLPLALSPISLA